MKQITVIGAGVMGHGIAQVYAGAGHNVILYDTEKQALENASEAIRKSLESFYEIGMIAYEDIDLIVDRIRLTTDLEDAVQESDFITEVIPEVLEWKQALYEQIEFICKPEAIIASNTSTFPLSKLTAKAQKKDRMIVTHFFNPGQIVPLVEIVKQDITAKHVIDETVQLLKEAGKTPVILQKEIPGFIANRLQAAVVREAFSLVEKGVASIEDIDLAITHGPGFRWAFIGPIETTDFGGLDTWQRVLNQVCPDLDSSISAPNIINNMVQNGHLGVKSGKGFNEYNSDAVLQRIEERDRNFLQLLQLKNMD